MKKYYLKEDVDFERLKELGATKYKNDYVFSDYKNYDAELLIENNEININIYANHDFPNLDLCMMKFYQLIKANLVEEKEV